MRRSSRRSLRTSLRLCGALLAAASLSACVTQGTHQEVVDERDGLATDKARLERRVEDLERSSDSLGAERARLIDEMEDLRQAQEQLDRDVRPD